MDFLPHIIVNANAGGVSGRANDLHTRLVAAVGGRPDRIEFVEPADLTDAIHRVLDSDDAPILVGGGDGTLATAADLTAARGRPLGILPLGTMNLLAADLGIPSSTGDLPDYHGATVRRIDGGMAGDRLFLCSAVIGIVPESAIKREAVRRHPSISGWADFALTLARGLTGHEAKHLRLTIGPDTAQVEVSALVVSNNRFQPHGTGARYRRASLTEGKLAVYGVCPHGAGDAARLLFKLMSGDWHEDGTVFHFETPELTVDTGAAEMLVSLDGEPVTLPGPLRFRSLPSYVPMLVPANIST